MVDRDLIVVFEGSYVEVDLLKSLLDANGITSFLKDQVMGTIAPMYASPGGVNAVKLLIPRVEYEDAMPIIDDFSNKRFDSSED